VTQVKLKRDWFSTGAGLTAAAILCATLVWAAFGPAALRARPWPLIWVNIVPPGPKVPAVKPWVHDPPHAAVTGRPDHS